MIEIKIVWYKDYKIKIKFLRKLNIKKSINRVNILIKNNFLKKLNEKII